MRKKIKKKKLTWKMIRNNLIFKTNLLTKKLLKKLKKKLKLKKTNYKMRQINSKI